MVINICVHATDQIYNTVSEKRISLHKASTLLNSHSFVHDASFTQPINLSYSIADQVFLFINTGFNILYCLCNKFNLHKDIAVLLISRYVQLFVTIILIEFKTANRFSINFDILYLKLKTIPNYDFIQISQSIMKSCIKEYNCSDLK